MWWAKKKMFCWEALLGQRAKEEFLNCWMFAEAFRLNMIDRASFLFK